MIALHWLCAALVLALLILGWLMVHGGYGAAERFDMYQLHKSLGFAALALFVVRGAVKAGCDRADASPDAIVGTTFGADRAHRHFIPVIVDLDPIGLACCIFRDRRRAHPFL